MGKWKERHSLQIMSFASKTFPVVLLTEMFGTAKVRHSKQIFCRHASFFDLSFFLAFRPKENYEKSNLVDYLNDYYKVQPHNICDLNFSACLKTPC